MDFQPQNGFESMAQMLLCNLILLLMVKINFLWTLDTQFKFL